MTDEHVPGTLEEYANNPFIKHLPTEPELDDIRVALDKPPRHSPTDLGLRPGQRWHCVMRLAEYSQPTNPALQFGMYLDLIIKRGYVGRDPTTTDYVRGLERAVELEEKAAAGASWTSLDLLPQTDTSLGFAALGMPGGGKTHTVKRVCARYPQVIKHTDPFLLNQIVWLRVECPPSGSPKSLCEFFFQQVDSALRRQGVQSRYQDQYKGKTLDVMMAGMARVATLHAIGVLIVDEIQHVKRVKQDVQASVLNFLVTLRNSIGIPVVMVGTMAAQRLLRRTFHDARRGDGMGSIYFERLPPGPKNGPGFGPEFRMFVKQMWRWQWTLQPTELDDAILKAMYEETQGVIDLMVKLFILLQLRLVMAGSKRKLPEVITPSLIHDVARERFRIVATYVSALRENDPEKLAEFEDLIDFEREFNDYVQGIGFRLEAPVVAESHGAGPGTAAGVTGGVADESTYEILLAAQGIPPERRDWILAKAKELALGDEVGAMMLAMSQAIAADRALQSPAKNTKLKPAEPIEGDAPADQKPGETAEEVYARLEAAGHVGFTGDP